MNKGEFYQGKITKEWFFYERRNIMLTKNFSTVLLIMLIISFSAKLSWAIGLPFSFHTEAKIGHNKMYGYVDVNIGADGKGLILVKFSNGNQLLGANFNANVHFVLASGVIIAAEHFESGIGPAGFNEVIERYHRREVPTSTFHHIVVRFFLSNKDSYQTIIPIYRDRRAF